MNTKISCCFLIIGSLIFTACGDRQAPAVAEQAASAPAVPDIPKYSAEDFFKTTSFGLVGPASHAFAPVGKSV